MGGNTFATDDHIADELRAGARELQVVCRQLEQDANGDDQMKLFAANIDRDLRALASTLALLSARLGRLADSVDPRAPLTDRPAA